MNVQVFLSLSFFPFIYLFIYLFISYSLPLYTYLLSV